MKNPHIFSFFSGVGFLDLGFETTSHDVVFVNEVHEPFLDAYRYSRENLGMAEPIYGGHLGSVETFVNGKKHPYLRDLVAQSRKSSPFVGFIAGPPCPDFSVGGKNRGRKGDKGKLSLTYINLVCEHKPDFFLFENVKGLWRTKRHRKFYEEIKRKTQKAGYVTTERVINAIEYGVPQDRDRIILVGFRKDLLAEAQIPFTQEDVLGEDVFPWRRYAEYSRDEVLSLAWPSVDPFAIDEERQPPEEVPLELTVEHWFHRNSVDKHPNAEHHFQPRAGLPKFMSIDEGDDSRKSYKRLHRWRFSPTAAYGNNEVHLHPYKARRISAAEAMAVQSLPADFCLPPDMSLTNMFKAIGNGVPYLASQALAMTIQDFLKDLK